MDWSRGHIIGRGSTATVSVATSRISGDMFAVKSAELTDSEMLQREQKLLSTLCSPYIVGYIGNEITRENNKLIYNLFMEYVPKGTLFDTIRGKGGRLDDSAIRYYTCQILQGLQYLHSSGIAHCDIKSRNILMGEKGLKIADLGCAKWIDSDRQEVTATLTGGTPMFMAPEVARGEEQGFSADIWALGCSIIEMATGNSPWPDATDPVSILYKIGYSGELPEFPDGLSGQAKDFLSKCLRRDPKERWTAKELLKHPFLENFNSFSNPIQEFNTSSPTSILVQDIWNSMECSSDVVQTSSSSSPGKRIRRLSLSSSEPGWDWDENWITIRCNMEDGDRNVAAGVCGSVTEMEVGSSGVVGEELQLNFLETNVWCNHSSSVLLKACPITCTEEEHSIVLSSNLNFERLKVNQALLL